MSNKLPPIPYGSPPGSSFWNDWYEKIRLIINQTLASFVASFNGRTGAVTLISGDVTTALGFTPGTGTVTSVAATVPSVLSISGSPITTSGTLAISYSGTALPVVNGGTGTTTSTGTGSVVLSASPTLTATPTAPTAATGTNTTQIATTAFVNTVVTGPAFSAYQSSAQTLGAAVATKIQFQTEEFDTAAAFDSTTNYRFTPLTAGYYQISACISDGLTNSFISVYKNGAEFKRGSQSGAGTAMVGLNVSTLVFCNGSTDYLEIYGFIAAGGTLNTGALTYFQAFLARAA